MQDKSYGVRDFPGELKPGLYLASPTWRRAITTNVTANYWLKVRGMYWRHARAPRTRNLSRTSNRTIKARWHPGSWCRQFVRDNIDSAVNVGASHVPRRQPGIKREQLEKKNTYINTHFHQTKHEATAVNSEFPLFLDIKVPRKEYLEQQNYGQATLSAHACSVPVRQSTYTTWARVPRRSRAKYKFQESSQPKLLIHGIE